MEDHRELSRASQLANGVVFVVTAVTIWATEIGVLPVFVSLFLYPVSVLIWFAALLWFQATAQERRNWIAYWCFWIANRGLDLFDFPELREARDFELWEAEINEAAHDDGP